MRTLRLVQLGHPAEELLVQAEDVAHFTPRPHPVLRREAEHRQPADVALHGQPNDGGQVLLALRVARGPWQVAASCPATVPSMMQAT
jgi:hypothetical protein